MQTVESVSDTRFIATQKLIAGDTHMDLSEVLFHARDDGLTRHADIPPAVVPFDEIDIIGVCLTDELREHRQLQPFPDLS